MTTNFNIYMCLHTHMRTRWIYTCILPATTEQRDCHSNGNVTIFPFSLSFLLYMQNPEWAGMENKFQDWKIQRGSKDRWGETARRQDVSFRWMKRSKVRLFWSLNNSINWYPHLKFYTLLVGLYDVWLTNQ